MTIHSFSDLEDLLETDLSGAPGQAVLGVEGGAGGELLALVGEGEEAGLTRHSYSFIFRFLT